jgi:type IV secretory pathway VirB10-like protein
MNLRKGQPRSVMDVLIERNRSLPKISDSVRVRVLARARATSALDDPELEYTRAMPIVHRRGLAMALAAVVACGVGAAGAGVLLRNRPVAAPPTAPISSERVEQASCTSPVAPPPAQTAASQPSGAPTPQRAERSLSAQESYAAELALLQGAQAAYTDRNFATALHLVTEHARRFPNGRLAEEREALRVKALSGSGRQKDADKAASSFSERFPRSALLRRSGQEPTTGR